MKTLKRIPLGIVNITATPHDKDGLTYVNLFQSAAKLEGTVRIKGDEHALLATFTLFDNSNPLAGGFGEIHKYTEIKGEWENIRSRKKASDTDLEKLSIPEHLRPNREEFKYFLFPKEHRMVFQMRGVRRTISQKSVKDLLTVLFTQSSIRSQWPLVNVVIEQEPSSWQAILDLPQLDKLTIEIDARPNTGDGFTAEEEKFVEGLLVDQGAKSLVVELTHAPGVTLVPNETNKKLGRVATKHGKVVAHGKDIKNRPKTIDTSTHPVTEDFDYNLKSKESLFDQMRAAARRLVDRVIG